MIGATEGFDLFDRSGSTLLRLTGSRLSFRRERREKNASGALEFVVDGDPVEAWAQTYESTDRGENGKRIRTRRIEIEKIPFGDEGLDGSWSVKIGGSWIPLDDLRTEGATFDAQLQEGA